MRTRPLARLWTGLLLAYALALQVLLAPPLPLGHDAAFAALGDEHALCLTGSGEPASGAAHHDRSCCLPGCVGGAPPLLPPLVQDVARPSASAGPVFFPVAQIRAVQVRTAGRGPSPRAPPPDHA
ncbi:MAG: hypothetical protein U1E62_09585 [Alsobacter sp.]